MHPLRKVKGKMLIIPADAKVPMTIKSRRGVLRLSCALILTNRTVKAYYS